MADRGRRDGASTERLLVWGLSTFHAALFVALVVVALYGAGLLGNQLAALDTVVGVVAYAYLWGVAWWTNRRWLDGVGTDLLDGAASGNAVLAAAVMWGGVAGLLVFVPTFVVVGALFVGAGGLGAIPFLLLGAAIGAALSAGVGALVGGVFAGLDRLLLRAARAWFPVAAAASEPADP